MDFVAKPLDERCGMACGAVAQGDGYTNPRRITGAGEPFRSRDNEYCRLCTKREGCDWTRLNLIPAIDRLAKFDWDFESAKKPVIFTHNLHPYPASSSHNSQCLKFRSFHRSGKR